MKKRKKPSNGLVKWIVIAVLLAVAVILLVIVGIRFMEDTVQAEAVDETAEIHYSDEPRNDTLPASSETKPITAPTEKQTTTTPVPVIVTLASTPEEQTTSSEAVPTETALPVIETTVATVSETTGSAASATTVSTTSETTASSDAPQTTEAVTTAAGSDVYDISYFANDLFIGDSIYTGLYLYGYFPKSQVFAAVGMGPNTASTVEIDGYTAAGRAKEMQPPHIFIMLGTNGLAYLDASFMADSMKTLVSALHEVSPDSLICVISIPPVTYEHELGGNETMAKVNKYNSLLQNAASECGAEYLDLCSQLQNENGYFSSRFAEADGLHFLGAAYKRMLSFLQHETQQ